ncbi:hypothetical protein RvY_02934 [Ramazzottius varieornatus]|uniref:Queuine tRNA-ribosyltransferase catalytic subunit 1 n=1 Tax=Ramazzottius varieornatus TaxID=947166 RepID=A0A1D1UWI3_RAMVA|nr:hypothetical protein RvY_02934 [Ramazzottius varieornatus]
MRRAGLSLASNAMTSADKFTIIEGCSVSKARTGLLQLSHYVIETPMFMPVGTKGCMKGVLPEQLEELDVQIILGNTYHLGLKPGPELLRKAGGLHKFMNWKRGMLTDSGGFQMVSLLKLTEITEEGVQFESPYSSSNPSTASKGRKKWKSSTGTEKAPGSPRADGEAVVPSKDLMMLTPEKSMEIQNAIGADIMMQLDDVVSSTTTGPRVEEAMDRSIRWLKRCGKAHSRADEQFLFPIVQGGLNMTLRERSVSGILEDEYTGYAIGGLSGGEAKNDFWKVVDASTTLLPKSKPRYVMGVGYAEDLVVCCALGADMFDCVFPTRTARFGCALVDAGQLNLRLKQYASDHTPIDPTCKCLTCQRYTRSYLHHIVTDIPTAARLMSIHNIAYQMNLMRRIRNSLRVNRFPEFVTQFMQNRYGDKEIPSWITDALTSVGIVLTRDTQAVSSDSIDSQSDRKKRSADGEETGEQ